MRKTIRCTAGATAGGGFLDFDLKGESFGSPFVLLDVAEQSVFQDKLWDAATPTGGVYAGVQLWAGGPQWAKWNVGANSETEYGDLFAWGATKPYRLNGSTVLDKTDNYNQSNAAAISKDLNPNGDAASVNMGAGWRMPTKAEFEVLLANTNCSWTSIGGVNGFKCADKRDASNYIFFPASGYVEGSSLKSRGSGGFYWSRSFSSSMYEWRFGFNSSGQNVDANHRYFGYSVRGVRS